jgi:hypothetical protein
MVEKMETKIAQLDKEEIEIIKAFENLMKITIVAYERNEEK